MLAFVAVRWLLSYTLAVLGVLVFWVASQQGVAQEAAMAGKAAGSCMGCLARRASSRPRLSIAKCSPRPREES